MTRDWSPAVPDPALDALAGTPRLLVALDFDGTCAPLVTDAMSARALPTVAAQVARLAGLPGTHVAFVSGRSLHDLREIAEHRDDSPVALVGSHGAQFWFPGTGEAPPQPPPAELPAVLDTVRALLADHPGVRLEPKSFGLGLHTRGLPPETGQRALAELGAAVGALVPDWRRVPGDEILEFTARHEGKDAGVRALRARTGATGVLFAGDDVTDEDAQRVLGPGDLGVRVGPGESLATLRVRGPEEVAALLRRVADVRARAADVARAQRE